MGRTVTNQADVIDSRDVITRIEELEIELRAAYRDEIANVAITEDTPPTNIPPGNFEDWIEWAATKEDGHPMEWEADEYRQLKAFAEDGECRTREWCDGATFIRESYFEEYAQQLAEDIGAISKGESWPCNYIDWKRAAAALRWDYTSVEFDGVTYYVRS